MVSDAVGQQTKATANGATELFAEPGAQLVLKPGFPVFSGKHEMIEKASIRLGHRASRIPSATPPGL